MKQLTKRIQKKILREIRVRVNILAKKRIASIGGLYTVLIEYLKQTHFPGKHFYKWLFLYRYVRKNMPKEILECGSGISTVVMAYALMENEKETGERGRITSMDELGGEYFTRLLDIFPKELKQYVNFVYSPKVEDYYDCFRGVRYTDIPDNAYDFVFIDGPTTDAPSDGMETFDMDFITILQKTEQPVHAVIDNRKNSFFVLKTILDPAANASFNKITNIGTFGPCTKEHLRPIGVFARW